MKGGSVTQRSSGRRPRGPRLAPRVPFALLVFGLAVCGLTLLLVLNTASAANELERHELAAKDASVSARLEQVRIEVAASAAPENLARAASQLGMVPAGNPAFLRFGADGKVTLLGSPAPVTVAAPPPPPPPAAPKPTTTTPKPTTTAAARGQAAPPSTAHRGTPTQSTSSKPPKPSGPKPTATSTAVPITALPGGTR
jgi:hypothetical protein